MFDLFRVVRVLDETLGLQIETVKLFLSLGELLLASHSYDSVSHYLFFEEILLIFHLRDNKFFVLDCINMHLGHVV